MEATVRRPGTAIEIAEAPVGAVVAHANAFPQCWVVLRTEMIAVMSEAIAAVCDALRDAAAQGHSRSHRWTNYSSCQYW